MNQDTINKLADTLIAHVQAYVDKKLEQRPPIEYAGTFESDKAYSRGQCVTHQGSVWYCALDTATAPGGGNPLWTLMVKAGRDGRDAR